MLRRIRALVGLGLVTVGALLALAGPAGAQQIVDAGKEGDGSGGLAFVLMVVSGVLLFFAIPLRTYHNVFFRLKAVLLIAAALNAWVFHNGGMYRRLAEWDNAAVTPRAAKLAGAFSLALWVAIIFSGRMIAYNWFDCDKPEPAVIDLLAGCVR